MVDVEQVSDRDEFGEDFELFHKFEKTVERRPLEVGIF